MMWSWPLLLVLQAAAPVTAVTTVTAKAPDFDDEEIIGNLELLENWDMLSRLGVLDDMDVVSDEEGGEKP